MLACYERYGDAHAFLVTFNPDKITEYCKQGNLERVYTGTAPALATVKLAYGDSIADLWLGTQIKNLSNLSGAKQQLNRAQFEVICQVIKTQFGYLKVTELMHFFLQFMAGKYGHFYGAVDCIKITEALQQFARERFDLISKFEAEREKRERAEKKARDLQAANDFDAWLDDNGISLSDYLYMGDYGIEKSEMPDLIWLLRLGYERTENQSKTVARLFGRA